tara:strand:- start:2049 stop:3152 length:1104 start_codon:yes stop_codon:yes gene_type:complete
MTEVCWVSIDPVRRKLDFYPKAIASRIEKAYGERDPWQPSACVLGSDFFNATIHFHVSGSCYQTTPGMSMGRAGFKQTGYRSVKRATKPATGDSVVVFSKQVHGEWRIALTESDSEFKFEERMPSECIVEGSADLTDDVFNRLNPWSGDDLASGAWDQNVVVWQWCRGTPENQGNLMALSEEWWCPYLQDQNSTIETAFSLKRDNAEIEIIDRGTYTIIFNGDQAFASQRDSTRRKNRMIRRSIKSVQELKVMIDRMACPPFDLDEIISRLPDGTTPHHFYCAITQAIMVDPVKTIDGMTYDRPAIVRWFQEHSTSPLTGLSLASKALTPNTTLKEQIEAFIHEHTPTTQTAQTAQTVQNVVLVTAQ